MTDRSEPVDSFESLVDALIDDWPPVRWRDVGVVVGCSGGADSVALTMALCRARIHVSPTEAPRGFVVAAHFNHGLRAEQSDADESFVREFADQMGIRFASRRTAQPHRDEATMRSQRLDFLTEIAHHTGARYVALAHSADDNVETVLHHLMRGTGPAGLAGIGNPRNLGEDLVLVRPLLNVRRELIRRGLIGVGQSWREDASNADIDYRRNWIRHRLIPMMESEFPTAVPAIARAIDGQRQWRQLIDELSKGWMLEHLQGTDPLTINRDSKTVSAVVVAALQSLWAQQGWARGEMSRDHWNRLVSTIQSSNQQRYSLPGKIEIDADGQRVVIRPA